MVIKKINYYDVCKTFKKWLAKNEHRFDRKGKVPVACCGELQLNRK
jgi:hypothetical protein